MRDINGSETDSPCVTHINSGNVYPVGGKLRHSAGYIVSFNKNHVRVTHHSNENSGFVVDQSYVGIMVSA